MESQHWDFFFSFLLFFYLRHKGINRIYTILPPITIFWREFKYKLTSFIIFPTFLVFFMTSSSHWQESSSKPCPEGKRGNRNGEERNSVIFEGVQSWPFKKGQIIVVMKDMRGKETDITTVHPMLLIATQQLFDAMAFKVQGVPDLWTSN